LSVQLDSEISNLCDHNTPTLPTDRQTDRQTTCDGNTGLLAIVHRAVETEVTIAVLLNAAARLSTGHPRS